VNTFVLPDGTSISDTNANIDIDTNTVIGIDTKTETETETETYTDTNIDTDTSTGPDTDTNVNITKDKSIPTDSKKINYGNNGTMDIASDISSSKVNSLDDVVTEVNNFRDENIQFTTDKVELGSGSDKITYYVSDIYVTKVNYIKTAFATGEYGKNLRDSTADMADANDALLAISGDFYGNGETGIVIRNGILYRSVIDDADICVLFTDGTMKTYSPEEFNAEEVVEQGAWQAWTFGPQLLDGKGNILASFNSTTYLNSTNPRCAIGYIEPGHYVFVVVDGRDEGYSMGVTLSELAQIMVKAGCVTAYNLDGGKSAAMVFDGSYVNQPSQGGRTVSDIVYIGE
jgi:exopolysaccharide biosynthesis protein